MFHDCCLDTYLLVLKTKGSIQFPLGTPLRRHSSSDPISSPRANKVCSERWRPQKYEHHKTYFGSAAGSFADSRGFCKDDCREPHHRIALLRSIYREIDPGIHLALQLPAEAEESRGFPRWAVRLNELPWL